MEGDLKAGPWWLGLRGPGSPLRLVLGGLEARAGSVKGLSGGDRDMCVMCSGPEADREASGSCWFPLLQRVPSDQVVRTVTFRQGRPCDLSQVTVCTEPPLGP